MAAEDLLSLYWKGEQHSCINKGEISVVCEVIKEQIFSQHEQNTFPPHATLGH